MLSSTPGNEKILVIEFQHFSSTRYRPRMIADRTEETRALAIAAGKALALLRTRAGLTQAEAADRLGKTQGYWEKYEAARNNALLRRDVLDRVTAALGVTVQDFYAALEDFTEPHQAAQMPPLIYRFGGASAQPEHSPLSIPFDGYAKAGPSPNTYDEPHETEFDLSAYIRPTSRAMLLAGESMVPYAEPGGFIVYDTKEPPQRNKGALIRMVDGSNHAKKYLRTTDSHVECLELEPRVIDGMNAYVEKLIYYPLKDVSRVFPIVVRGD